MSQGAAHVRSAGERVEPGAIIAGKYTILRRLSGGAPGAWLSRSSDPGEPLIALHVLCPPQAETLARRFDQELSEVAKLQHPQLLPVSAFGRSGDRFYVAHAPLEVPNLNQLIENDWPLPEPRIAQLLLQLLAALEVAHDAGLAHGDLHPGNLLLRSREDESALEELVLCGLGLARYAPFEVPPTGPERLIQLGTHFVGTPEYAAPEQLRGEAHDARSDVYGVGLLLFQLLTRTPPFLGETVHEVAWKQCFTPPPPPSGYTAVSSPLEAVCLKALSKTPEFRYQSAAEMRAALLAALKTRNTRPTRRLAARPVSQAPQVVVSHAVPMRAARDEAPASHAIPQHALVVRSSRAQVLPGGLTHEPVSAVSFEAPASAARKRGRGTGFGLVVGGCLLGAIGASAAPHVDRLQPWLDSVRASESSEDGDYAAGYDEHAQPDFFAAQEPEPQAPERDQRQVLVAAVAVAKPSDATPDGLALLGLTPAAIAAPGAAHEATASAADVLPPSDAKPRRSQKPRRAEPDVTATAGSEPAAAVPPQLSIAPWPGDSFEARAPGLPVSAAPPAADAAATPSAADAPVVTIEAAIARPEPAGAEPAPPPSAPAMPARVAAPAGVLREPARATFASPVDSDRARVAFSEVDSVHGAVSNASLRAALNKAAIVDCYRSVVRTGQAPAAPIHAELSYETNATGRIVSANLRGSNLPPALERCVEDVARLGRVREADTGSIEAALSVSFLPE